MSACGPRSERRIVVFGSGSCARSQASWRTAYRVGKLLASRRLLVVTGGYGGAMEAVSQGAREAGGRVHGVTTRSFTRRVANPYLHKEVRVASYLARLVALLETGHGFVALPGALGTLSEWITAWSVAMTGELGGPLWVFEDPWRKFRDAVFELPEVRALPAEVLARGDRLRWVRDPRDLGRQVDAWLAASSHRVRPARTPRR